MKLSDRIKALSPQQRAALRKRLDQVVRDQNSPVNPAASEARLVAYVISRNVSAVGEGELRQFLKTKLPEYMVPSAFVIVDSLPVTANGKVDLQALLQSQPHNAITQPINGVKKQTILSPVEEQLVEIWRELLGVAKVDADDNFFFLGGHSLLALRLLARLRKVFQIDLQLKNIFESPTVATLAVAIGKAQKTGPGGPIKKIPRLSAEQFQSRVDSVKGHSVSPDPVRPGEAVIRK
jgi:acyl carrier protein